jgi:hypothetical protein
MLPKSGALLGYPQQGPYCLPEDTPGLTTAPLCPPQLGMMDAWKH